MSLFCPVAKVGHWFLNFSKARILCSVPEGFGYAFFMLSSITNVCSSFQLIDQQIMLRFFFISEHFTVFKSVCSVRNVQPCLEWLWQGFKQKAHLNDDILVNVFNWEFKEFPMCAGILLPPMLSHELGVKSIANGLNQFIESNARNYWHEPVLSCSRITSCHTASPATKQSLKSRGSEMRPNPDLV